MPDWRLPLELTPDAYSVKEWLTLGSRESDTYTLSRIHTHADFPHHRAKSAHIGVDVTVLDDSPPVHLNIENALGIGTGLVVAEVIGQPLRRLHSRKLTEIQVHTVLPGRDIGPELLNAAAHRLEHRIVVVDLGYNLEMSLWGLARYAVNLEDSLVLEAVLKSARNHLAFVYPDGMMDYSAGIRSNKWTIYGSGTSDGPHPLFALLSSYDSSFVSAAVRSIDQISRNFSSCGLLGFGPSYDQIWSSAPCIYPTFTKAKSLAMALSWIEDDPVELPALQCDKNFDRYFQSLNTAVVRRGPFMATITAYNYKAKEAERSKYMHRPSGGAMSVLWVEGFGLLEASSQSEYHRWEPMSFPEIPAPLPLTPRIELRSGTMTASNLYDFDATMLYSASDEVKCRVMGNLRDHSQSYAGVGYTIEYEFSDEGLIKRYKAKRQTARGKIFVVEPILVDPDLKVLRSDADLLVLERNSVKVCIRCKGANMVLRREESAEYRHIYPSLQAIPLEIELGDEAVELRYSLMQRTE